MTESDKKQKLIEARERLINKTFYILFEIFAYIAVPALIAVRVARGAEGVPKITWIIVALALSWFLILRRFRTVKKRMDEIESQIKEITDESPQADNNQ